MGLGAKSTGPAVVVRTAASTSGKQVDHSVSSPTTAAAAVFKMPVVSSRVKPWVFPSPPKPTTKPARNWVAKGPRNVEEVERLFREQQRLQNLVLGGLVCGYRVASTHGFNSASVKKHSHSWNESSNVCSSFDNMGNNSNYNSISSSCNNSDEMSFYQRALRLSENKNRALARDNKRSVRRTVLQRNAHFALVAAIANLVRRLREEEDRRDREISSYFATHMPNSNHVLSARRHNIATEIDQIQEMSDSDSDSDDDGLLLELPRTLCSVVEDQSEKESKDIDDAAFLAAVQDVLAMTEDDTTTVTTTTTTSTPAPAASTFSSAQAGEKRASGNMVLGEEDEEEEEEEDEKLNNNNNNNNNNNESAVMITTAAADIQDATRRQQKNTTISTITSSNIYLARPRVGFVPSKVVIGSQPSTTTVASFWPTAEVSRSVSYSGSATTITVPMGTAGVANENKNTSNCGNQSVSKRPCHTAAPVAVY